MLDTSLFHGLGKIIESRTFVAKFLLLCKLATMLHGKCSAIEWLYKPEKKYF